MKFSITYKKLFFLCLCAIVSVGGQVLAQNVNYQIYTTRYYTGRSNSDFWSSDDQRWRVLFYDNVDGFAAGNGVIVELDNTMDGPAWYNPADYLCRTATNTSATGLRVRVEGWEDDGCGASNTFDTGCSNDDEAHCNSVSATLNFRSDPPCQWNTYQYHCDGNWGVEYRVYWDWAVAPTITTQPSPVDRNLCVGSTTLLSVIANTPARFYKWQVSTSTSCTGATGWADVGSGSGGTTANYTPPQTPGTRVYRCLITSNCTADFSTKTTTSNCVRVNYFPFAAPIQSSVCGLSTSIGSTQTFSALQPPTVGAVANTTYIWSTSPATTISASTSATTNITFPAAGSYTITLTTVPPAGSGCVNTTSTCTVTVNAPACDFIYVDPATGNTSGGSSNSPVSLNGAMALISSSRNHVRIIGGTFTGLPTMTIPSSTTASNIIIEGGYVNTGGLWTKSSSAVTSLTFNGTENISADVEHVVGIKAINTVGLTLQDLTIRTIDASGVTGSGRGKSNYALWMNNCSGTQIVRCDIRSNAASNGNNGSGMGTNGNGGPAGNNGNNGSCDGSHGNGGVGVTGPGSGTRKGGDGGAGGKGGNEGNNAGSAGSLGSNGGGGAARDGSVGGGGNGGDPGSAGGNASGAITTSEAANGTSGSGYTAGARPTNFSLGLYFTPGTSANGSDGTGGGGGAGGGGGGGQGCTFCDNGGGNGAGAGGAGGEGGQGGNGAKGGGASFAIYVSGAAPTFTNIVANSLAAGTGGNGQSGGSGGTGGNGGSGAATCTGEVGRGGNGSKGGNGGAGGRGEDGANGLTSHYVLNNVVQASPSTSISNPTNALVVLYNNTKGCTNSYITLDKNAGTWSNYGATGAVVNDITTSTSSFNTSSDPISVYYTSMGWKDVTTTTDTRARLVYISTSRTPPVINGISTPLCMDGQLSLTCTPNSPSNVAGYEWTVQETPVTGLLAPTPVFTSGAAAPVFTLPNTGTSDITYQIKLRVNDECCGWSIPVYATVVVRPAITAGAISGAQTICYNGDPAILNNATAPANTVGTPTYEWFYQENCAGPWIAIASSNANTYNPPAGLTETRCYQRRVTNCSRTETSNTIQVDVLADFNAGSISSQNDTLCAPADPASIAHSINPSGGAGTYSFQWYYRDGVNACPSGTATTGWTLISGANLNDYDPPAGLTTSRTYALQVDATGAPDCGTARWASGCFQIIVNPEPAAFTPSVITTLPLCYRGNAQIDVASTQNGIKYQLRDNITNVNASQVGNGGTLTFHTLNLTANTNTYNVLATDTVTGCSRMVAVPNITVTPTPTALANNNDTRVCYVNGNNAYVEFISSNGSILAVNPGSQNLGYVTVREYVDGTPIGIQACGTSPVNQPQFNAAAMGRRWTISSTVSPSANLDVRLYFANSDVTALAAASSANVNPTDDLGSIADLELNKYSGANENGTYTDNCGSGVTTMHVQASNGGITVPNTGYVVSSSSYSVHTISSFSELWLSGTKSISPLPIELTSFTASCVKGQVQLDWVTATEINNEKFIIDRSADMQAWEEVLTKAGAGNSNQQMNYQGIDLRPLQGVSYYRLTQRDYDGASETFAPISITCYTDGNGNSMMVYPNPVDDQFTVNINLVETCHDCGIEITDMNGKRIILRNISMNKGENTYTFDRSSMNPGQYIIQLKSGDFVVKPVKLIVR